MDTPFEEASDDEIFIGKLNIKEIKKRLGIRQEPRKKNDTCSKKDLDSSLRLIETHSAPNLRSLADSPVLSSPFKSQGTSRYSDDSFIQIEDMVSKLGMSSHSENGELNNTLEIVDYILNHGPNKNPVINKDENKSDVIKNPVLNKDENKSDVIMPPLKIDLTDKPSPSPVKDSMKKCSTEETNKTGSPNSTPAATQSSVSLKSKTSVFKTPIKPPVFNKPVTPKGTPRKINSYQHISSPIASYIKQTPQVPLVKDVHPKRALPGSSFIPKHLGYSSQSKMKETENKENTHLPFVAYKSAKITKVVKLPDQDKLPQSQWVKKMTSIPRPTVMKHEKREMNPIKKRLLSNQEHSFANLSYHQADVSVCTEKTAFKSTNKH